jgi:hypothetical protein
MERMYESDLLILRVQLSVNRRYVSSVLLVMNNIQLR